MRCVTVAHASDIVLVQGRTVVVAFPMLTGRNGVFGAPTYGVLDLPPPVKTTDRMAARAAAPTTKLAIAQRLFRLTFGVRTTGSYPSLGRPFVRGGWP